MKILVCLIFGFSLILIAGCNGKKRQIDTWNKRHKEYVTNNPIVGKWQVQNSTVLPFEHISYCKELNLNSIFEFKGDKSLNVYEELEGELCTKDQSYNVKDGKLNIIEWDMLFSYEIRTLNSDTLILNIDRTPTYFWTEANLNDSKIKEILQDIKENGITITLTKFK